MFDITRKILTLCSFGALIAALSILPNTAMADNGCVRGGDRGKRCVVNNRAGECNKAGSCETKNNTVVHFNGCKRVQQTCSGGSQGVCQRRNATGSSAGSGRKELYCR